MSRPQEAPRRRPAPPAAASARRPSSRTGSRPAVCHAAGSTLSKRSWVSGCHDQRRLPASSASGCSGSGSTGRTVNRRMALTRSHRNTGDNGTIQRTSERPGFSSNRARYVEVMVGRIPVMDVSPVVEGGRYPAKATVGESFPVRATVFREGHDALNADVVLTGPDGVRRPWVRMTAGRDRAQPLARAGDPGRGRRVDVRDRELERPDRHLAARRRDQDPGRDRRRADVRRGRAAARAAGRRRCRSAPTSAARSTTPSPPSKDQRASRERPLQRRGLPRRRRRALAAPAARPGHHRGAVPVLRRPRARALRLLVRVLPPLRGRVRRRGDRARSSPAPSAPRPSASTPWRPWASTSSTCRRSTPSAG